MKRYEVISKGTFIEASKRGFSPNPIRDFASKDDAKSYVRNYYKNTEGRIADLVVCEVSYTPIFEITHTVSSQEKDL